MPRTSLPRLLAILSAACLAGLLSVAPASAAAQGRITAQISNNSRTTIAGSVHPAAMSAADMGPTAAGTKLLGMSLRFSMTDAQSAALDQLLLDQQNPASPSYHQWLTPAQFGAQFGLSGADIAKVTAWLTSQGFTVTGVANSSTFVTFNGTVAQAQTAFGTSIHNVSLNGETHFANISNVSVPSALAGVVGNVMGLHNFRLKPHLKASAVHPDYTSSLFTTHFMAPGDAYTIYDITSALETAGGAGETIAVTGQVDIYPADVSAFRSASGLSTTNLPTTVHPTFNGIVEDPGPPECNECTQFPNQLDLEESSIDVEWSGAMAPLATILFVSSDCTLPGTGCGTDSMTWAIDNNLAPIVTTSYGSCEAGWGSAEMTIGNALFKQANAQGQTVMAASGDSGATDCDAGPFATEGLTVDFPGSSPYVTSMGGTQFNDTTNASTYWNSANGTNGGSAKMYIPESVWNDESFDSFGGGGGGASAFFTKPTWQATAADVLLGVPTDGARDVPDLSLNASDADDPFLVCVNVALGASCTTGYALSNGDLDALGGTSFDSQIFGGMLALVEQQNGGARIGNANPVIYALANNSTYYSAGATIASKSGAVFNDVTAGNNAMACTTGSTNCPNGGSTGFSAGSGYDLGSGWGSVNVANLAAAWTKVAPLGVVSLGSNVSSTTLATSPACVTTVAGGPCNLSVTEGATVTLTATVTGSAGTPTGSVQFFANNVAVGSSPLSAGSIGMATATYSWVTSCSASSQQSMSASYSGDGNYQGSRGPALASGGGAETSNGSVTTSPLIVNITPSACPDFTLTPSGNGVTVSGSNGSLTVAAAGTIPPVTLTVAPVSGTGFTGTVVFSLASGTSTTNFAPTIVFTPTSVTISSSSSQTTSMAFGGITAHLQLPSMPGKIDSGTMLAQDAKRTHLWYGAGSGLTMASLFLLMFPRRRRLGGLLLVALAIALVGGATGCSSSQTGPPSSGGGTTTNSNPYAGTYTETVVGTYTSSSGQVTTHSATITYIIN